jgi:multidrug resistance protein, MATE family
MWIALFGYWAAGFATAIALGFYTPLEGLGVWIGLAVGLVVVAGLLILRWARRERLGLMPVAAPAQRSQRAFSSREVLDAT